MKSPMRTKAGLPAAELGSKEFTDDCGKGIPSRDGDNAGRCSGKGKGCRRMYRDVNRDVNRDGNYFGGAGPREMVIG
jgi:hypothetical protein